MLVVYYAHSINPEYSFIKTQLKKILKFFNEPFITYIHLISNISSARVMLNYITRTCIIFLFIDVEFVRGCYYG